ncbi:MAG TPA: hypothetical protein VN554_00510, partial [Verrucomicrobiae bacterium]|nr:hypothetical protein [Verrucomicrobiae bacterium]
MRPVLRQLKPTSGIAAFLHQGLLLILPVIVFVLVRLNLAVPAGAIIVLSKWRMFAVRPRFWAANIRANSVDLMVGLSVVLFMTHYDSVLPQVVWAVLYAIWLLAVKPGTTTLTVMIQAFIGQLVALSALYLTWADAPVYALTGLTGLLCFLAARHFFDAFDEPYAKMLSYVWGYFGAALAWLTSHWLL